MMHDGRFARRWVLAGFLVVALVGCDRHTDNVGTGLTAASTDLVPAEAETVMAAPHQGAESARTVRSTRLREKLLTADLLVVGDRSLGQELVDRVDRASGVQIAASMSLASVPVADRSITVAAVRPDVYRRFTAKRTAEVDAVWAAVAHGDVLISHELGRDLRQPLGGTLALRSEPSGVPLRVGGYATTVPQVDAVVNDERGDQLGMTPGNALLVSVQQAELGKTLDGLRDVVGKRANVQPISAAGASARTRQAAHLTGGAVAAAVGSFSYRYFPDGSVEPEAGWVTTNIRTESVPILGRVTGHRVMLPQLHAALSEVVERGLSDAIDAGDYGGCYVPRFIGRDPNRGLSLHTWGIAIDLNVASNQRGTVGEIDRRVVAIFKKWGFAWGGDWEWTDPMHFELAALVRGNPS